MPTNTLHAIDTFLRKQAESRPDRLVAVFDCDGTMIRGDIGEAMLYFQIEHLLFRVSPADVWPDHPDREELDGLYKEIAARPTHGTPDGPRHNRFADMVLSRYFDQIAGDELEKACCDIVRLLTGFSQSEVREIAARTVQYETASPVSTRTLGRYRLPRGIRFIHDSLQLLDFLTARGFDIWIVSGSNRWSVEAVFSRLGIPFGRVIGIELAESHGTLKPEVKTPVPVRQGKVQALRKHIAAPPLIVISDSVNDIPLLRYSAGLKVLMNSKGDNVSEFSSDGELTQDESWLVVESPAIEATDTQIWPTRQ